MPSSTEILASLSRIAQDGIALAILWHVLAAVAAVALLRGWRPARPSVAWTLLVLLASVSVLAWLHASYFNAAVLSALVLGLAAVAAQLPRQPLVRGPTWSRLAGAAMLGFGWFYPHFLDGLPWPIYLVAAPTGLLPCPTLSVLVGVSLLARGFGSKAWSAVLSAAGLFYAVFGATRLGVRIDVVLGCGSALLALAGLFPRQLGWAPPTLTPQRPRAAQGRSAPVRGGA